MTTMQSVHETAHPMETARPAMAGKPETDRMTISVVVPTYHRAPDMIRCLEALCRQERSPDEVVVVMRDTDDESHAALAAWEQAHPGALPLQTANVAAPGQVAALNAGLEAARGEIVAITDDDAAPQPQWLARAEEHFAANPGVGGVGGRDWVHEYGKLLDDSRPIVGRIQYWGRSIGNHHLGVGGPREVEMLKGANMIFRRSAIGDLRFNVRLRGNGAQMNNDMNFCLALRRKGWKLIYDPIVAVDHFPAPRHDEDQRGAFNDFAHQNVCYNETITMMDHLSPARQLAFYVWMFVVGTRIDPGLLMLLRLAARRDRHILRRWRATMVGRFSGIADHFRFRAGQSGKQAQT